MTYDWDGLARAIRVERARREWSQEDLAQRIGVSQGTIKNLEGAHSYKKPPVEHLRGVDAAFGWAEGTLEGILREEAAAVEEPATTGAPASLPALKDRLPTRLLMELEHSEIVDVDRYDLTEGGGVRMITFLITDPGSTPRDYEYVRRLTREWERAKRLQRGLKPLPWEPGDPEEWKSDSEG